MLGVTKMMDVTRERLAALVGVSTATVSRWEDDLRRPKQDAMLRLAQVLGVSPVWLDYGVEVDVPRPAAADVASGEVVAAASSAPKPPVPHSLVNLNGPLTPAPDPRLGRAKAVKGTPIGTPKLKEPSKSDELRGKKRRLG